MKPDMTLLKKIFQQGKMTTREISETFSLVPREVVKLRKDMGFETPKSMICPYCGYPKALNCFRAGQAGCIKCRIERGTEKHHWKGHGKQSKVIKMRGVLCHGCHKPFPKDFPVRFDRISKKRLDYYCPVCKAGNDEIDDFDELNVMFG